MRSRALGVDLLLPRPLLGLPRNDDPPGPRRATIELDSDSGLEWRSADEETRRLVEWKARDGVDPVLTLDVNTGHGYRIWASGFGAFCISADGSRVRCAPEVEDPAVWQRYLIGQVLPFVSVLQGIEVMHGSAVVLQGRTVAFMGGSGAGKTSLAARLLLRGATFVTDDVLALERDRQGVVVHPGPGILGVRHAEVAKLSDEERSALGVRLAENDKEVVFGLRRMEQPSQLDGLYVIQRDAEATELAFEPTMSAVPVLASAFNTVVGGRERLERMLDVFAQVAKCARVFNVTVPAEVDAASLAAAIEEHVEANLQGGRVARPVAALQW